MERGPQRDQVTGTVELFSSVARLEGIYAHTPWPRVPPRACVSTRRRVSRREETTNLEQRRREVNIARVRTRRAAAHSVIVIQYQKPNARVGDLGLDRLAGELIDDGDGLAAFAELKSGSRKRDDQRRVTVDLRERVSALKEEKKRVALVRSDRDCPMREQLSLQQSERKPGAPFAHTCGICQLDSRRKGILTDHVALPHESHLPSPPARTTTSVLSSTPILMPPSHVGQVGLQVGQGGSLTGGGLEGGVSTGGGPEGGVSTGGLEGGVSTGDGLEGVSRGGGKSAEGGDGIS